MNGQLTIWPTMGQIVRQARRRASTKSAEASLQASDARRLLRVHADPVKAVGLQRFFKTGPGEYAEGDRFLGVMVPQTRLVARTCADLSPQSIRSLIQSPFHEERLLGLLILTRQYQRGTSDRREALFRLYLQSRKWINNWDLVDSSAPYVVGPHLERSERKLLSRLAASKHLWDRRIAVLATFHFIRNGDFSDALMLCERLLADREDLMHKACGWMLREIGNRDRRVLERFLTRHAPTMPRTMLRYAVERLPKSSRRRFMTARSQGS
jgi:3-methyladenine DNA glycosylase AlkD